MFLRPIYTLGSHFIPRVESEEPFSEEEINRMQTPCGYRSVDLSPIVISGASSPAASVCHHRRALSRSVRRPMILPRRWSPPRQALPLVPARAGVPPKVRAGAATGRDWARRDETRRRSRRSLAPVDSGARARARASPATGESGEPARTFGESRTGERKIWKRKLFSLPLRYTHNSIYVCQRRF